MFEQSEVTVKFEVTKEVEICLYQSKSGLWQAVDERGWMEVREDKDEAVMALLEEYDEREFEIEVQQ